MHTEIKVVDGQEYVCLMTNDIVVDDMIITTSDLGNTLNEVIYTNKKGNMIGYKKISGCATYTVGYDTFRCMTDISKCIGRKCKMELDTLYAKVVGKGVNYEQ